MVVFHFLIIHVFASLSSMYNDATILNNATFMDRHSGEKFVDLGKGCRFEYNFTHARQPVNPFLKRVMHCAVACDCCWTLCMHENVPLMCNFYSLIMVYREYLLFNLIVGKLFSLQNLVLS